MATVYFRLHNRDSFSFSHNLTICDSWWLSNVAFSYIINADTHFFMNYSVPVKMISSVTAASNWTGWSVMLLTSVQQTLSSDLGRYTGYVYWDFFVVFFQANTGIVPWLGHGCFFSYLFQFISYPMLYSLTVLLHNQLKLQRHHPIIQHYIVK
jgi:hypothetical protein